MLAGRILNPQHRSIKSILPLELILEPVSHPRVIQINLIENLTELVNQVFFSKIWVPARAVFRPTATVVDVPGRSYRL